MKNLTTHAQKRASSRGVSEKAIELAMKIGRISYSKGAMFFWIGKKEIKKFINIIPDIASYEGVVVICSSSGGAILTTYRNKNFNKSFKWN